MRVFGLIPAAGKSLRMGRPKLSLPLGGRTVLELVIAAVKAAGVAEVLVVVGPHSKELIALAESAGARVLALATDTADMRATVQQGLDWLERFVAPQPGDAWLLLPADHPTLASAAVGALIAAWQAGPAASVLIPTCQGRRGHPALIGWQLAPTVQALPAGAGLNALFRSRPDVLEVPVSEPEILQDLDTPDDYRNLLARWRTASGGNAPADS